MFCGILIAVLAAIFAHTRGGLFLHGFTDPKVLLIAIGVIFAWYWRKGKSIRIVDGAAAGYMASLVPSTIASKSLAFSMVGIPGLYSGSLLTSGLCASGAVLGARLSEKHKEAMQRIIMASCALVALLCVLQFFGADPLRWPFPHGAPGIHGSIIDTGALLVAAVSVFPNPLYLVGIFATNCRAAWLGAAVALVPVRFRVAAFIVATVVGMTYTLSNSSPSSQERSDIWRGAVKASTVVGSGPSTFLMIYDSKVPGYKTANAHNAVLEAISTRGIIGLLGLFAVLIFPRFAGVWTIAMFQPISFEIVFVVCVLAGISIRTKSPAMRLI